MASSDQGRVAIEEELNKLTVEQVRQVKEQVDGEVGLLQDSLNRIRTAAVRYEMASKALHNLSVHPAGKQMLVPLTASLYVPGTLDDAHKVLIDIGTGYYVEVSLHGGDWLTLLGVGLLMFLIRKQCKKEKNTVSEKSTFLRLIMTNLLRLPLKRKMQQIK